MLSKEHFDFLFKKTCDYLYADRCNPDVGMGMFAESALQLAEQDMDEMIKLFGRHTINSATIKVTTAEREAILKMVRVWKEKNNI